jgi:hypothetical protein
MRSSPFREIASTTRVTARRSSFSLRPRSFRWGLSAVAGLGRAGASRFCGSPWLAALSSSAGRTDSARLARQRDEDQRAGLRQAVRFLETQLANYYDQWVNFFDFWPVHPRD